MQPTSSVVTAAASALHSAVSLQDAHAEEHVKPLLTHANLQAQLQPAVTLLRAADPALIAAVDPQVQKQLDIKAAKAELEEANKAYCQIRRSRVIQSTSICLVFVGVGIGFSFICPPFLIAVVVLSGCLLGSSAAAIAYSVMSKKNDCLDAIERQFEALGRLIALDGVENRQEELKILQRHASKELSGFLFHTHRERMIARLVLGDLYKGIHIPGKNVGDALPLYDELIRARYKPAFLRVIQLVHEKNYGALKCLHQIENISRFFPESYYRQWVKEYEKEIIQAAVTIFSQEGYNEALNILSHYFNRPNPHIAKNIELITQGLVRRYKASHHKDVEGYLNLLAAAGYKGPYHFGMAQIREHDVVEHAYDVESAQDRETLEAKLNIIIMHYYHAVQYHQAGALAALNRIALEYKGVANSAWSRMKLTTPSILTLQGWANAITKRANAKLADATKFFLGRLQLGDKHYAQYKQQLHELHSLNAPQAGTIVYERLIGIKTQLEAVLQRLALMTPAIQLMRDRIQNVLRKVTALSIELLPKDQSSFRSLLLTQLWRRIDANPSQVQQEVSSMRAQSLEDLINDAHNGNIQPVLQWISARTAASTMTPAELERFLILIGTFNKHYPEVNREIDECMQALEVSAAMEAMVQTLEEGASEEV